MPRAALRLEPLEGRLTPAIHLDLVSLHEFGHALGLDHTSDRNSIMYAYYNADYNLADFATDSAVATFRNLYSNVSAGPWRDSLDPTPGDGTVEITYSFVPDGTKMDKGSSNLLATFDKLAPRATWQQAFAAQLDRWASVSNGKVAFLPHSDDGSAFNYAGAAQNDSHSGDIRIGAHRFDGPNKVLAHTYFPPPNGRTAAGDSHYDSAEAWVLTGGSAALTGGGGTGGAGGGGRLGNLEVSGPGGEWAPVYVDRAWATAGSETPAAAPTASVSARSDLASALNPLLDEPAEASSGRDDEPVLLVTFVSADSAGDGSGVGLPGDAFGFGTGITVGWQDS